MPVICKCDVCGKDILKKPSHVTEHNYCSRECVSKAYNKRREVICQVCGKIFMVPNNKHRENAKFCSKKCMGIGKSGEKHVMWRGGLRHNAEYQRAVGRARYRKHTEMFIANAKKRKLRMKELIGSHTKAEWQELLERYNWKCAYCGTKLINKPGLNQATRDHVIPISKGGTDYIDNIVPACRSCNSKKNNRLDYKAPLIM